MLLHLHLFIMDDLLLHDKGEIGERIFLIDTQTEMRTVMSGLLLTGNGEVQRVIFLPPRNGDRLVMVIDLIFQTACQEQWQEQK